MKRLTFLAMAAALAAGCRAGSTRVESPAGGTARGAPSEGGTLEPGTRLLVQLDQPIDRDETRVGERFTATVAQALLGSDGRVIVPEGARVVGHVAELRGGDEDTSVIALAFDELRVGSATYPLRAEVIGTDVEAPRRGVDWRYVLGGAAGGGVLGAILGGVRGAVAGAILGGGAGTLISLGRSGEEGRLPEGTALGLEVKERITIRPSAPAPLAEPLPD